MTYPTRLPNLASAALLWLAACSTTPHEIGVDVPQVHDPAQGPRIVLRSVEDRRPFVAGEQATAAEPSAIDASSLGDPERLGRIIGAAFEDGAPRHEVLLEDGATVEELARNLLASAFRSAGFQVLDPAEADPRAHDVRVHVEDLWVADDGHGFYRHLRLVLVAAPPPLRDGHVIEVGGGFQHLAFVGRGTWRGLLATLVEEAMVTLAGDLAAGP